MLKSAASDFCRLQVANRTNSIHLSVEVVVIILTVVSTVPQVLCLRGGK